MDTIFTLDDNDDDNVKINLDELYERKQQYDLNTLAVYNKILKRIHTKIKTVSRQKIDEQFCWYIVPEMIIGIPRYDHGACTAYVIDKLRDNGFMVRYTHPNLLFISWKHWLPTYVRTELKKKTGIVIDGYGNQKSEQETNLSEKDPNTILLMDNAQNNTIKNNLKKQNDYRDITAYKPTGNLIYNQDLLARIQEKSSK
jgi:hypothetical protein